MENNYQIGTTVFGNWTIQREIGKGSFGKVFEIGRNDFGEHYSAALKVISVPQDKNQIRSLEEDGMSVAHTEEYLYSIVEDIVKEFAIMSKLKGTTNIVSYEDHQVIHHTDGIGWDILIRMELLSSFSSYTKDHPLTYRAVGQLGIDICRGLELCEKQKIVHRDIKPENIFVSANGDFKLGDFGVARTMERAAPGSIKGTYNYMAPEVYRGGAYDHRVDIYSLGLVLYKYLNNNRFPFLPLNDAIRYQDTENAFVRRIGGEMLPRPAYAPPQVADVILRACAFQPQDRFASASEMRQALERVLPLLSDMPIATAAPAAAPVQTGAPVGAQPAFTGEGTVVLQNGSMPDPNGTVILQNSGTAPLRPQPVQGGMRQPVPPVPGRGPVPGAVPTPAHIPNAAPVAQAGEKKKKKGILLPVILGAILVVAVVFALLPRDSGDTETPRQTADSTPVRTDVVLPVETTVADTEPAETEISQAPVTTVPVETLPASLVLADGTKEVYEYGADNAIVQKWVYDPNGTLTERHTYSYANGVLVAEKMYDGADHLLYEVAKEADRTVTVERTYDENGSMTGGAKYIADSSGRILEMHTLNAYDDVIASEFYDAEGKVTGSRQYHFTAAGYPDGYTEINAAGKKTRYNQDGSVRKEAAVTTKKPTKPTTPTQKTYTKTVQNADGSTSVYTYTKATDGTETLLQTQTYRKFNGVEKLLTNIDHAGGYGTENTYTPSGQWTGQKRFNIDKWGHRTLINTFDTNGALVSSETCTYDGQGRPVLRTYKDANGNVEKTVEYEYIPNSKKERGYTIKETTRDANGKTIGSPYIY